MAARLNLHTHLQGDEAVGLPEDPPRLSQELNDSREGENGHTHFVPSYEWLVDEWAEPEEGEEGGGEEAQGDPGGREGGRCTWPHPNNRRHSRAPQQVEDVSPFSLCRGLGEGSFSQGLTGQEEDGCIQQSQPDVREGGRGGEGRGGEGSQSCVTSLAIRVVPLYCVHIVVHVRLQLDSPNRSCDSLFPLPYQLPQVYLTSCKKQPVVSTESSKVLSDNHHCPIIYT